MMFIQLLCIYRWSVYFFPSRIYMSKKITFFVDSPIIVFYHDVDSSYEHTCEDTIQRLFAKANIPILPISNRSERISKKVHLCNQFPRKNLLGTIETKNTYFENYGTIIKYSYY